MVFRQPEMFLKDKLCTRAQHLSRRQMALMMAVLISIMPFSIDAYLPSLPQIATALHADIHHIEKSLSSFMFGVAIGQILGGSLSDIKGRRNIALVGLGIYLLGCIGLIFVRTADEVMLLRAVQAVGAGMSSVVVGALVRDNYHGKDAAQMFALIGIILMMAPLVAPTLGSMLAMLGGWRSIFVFLFVYASWVMVLLYRRLPKHKNAEPLHLAQVRQMGKRYVQVLTTKPALGFLFYQAAAFSALMAFLSESPFVYMQLYHLSAHQYAWVFGCNVITMMLCNRLTAFGLRHNWESRDLLKIGIAAQVAANLGLCAVVLLLKQPPLTLVVPFVMVAVGMQGLIVANTQAMFMSNYFPEIAGSANAILASLQSLIGAMVGYLVTQLHNGTALVMAGVMLASTGIGCVLLWCFSRQQLFGEKADKAA